MFGFEHGTPAPVANAGRGGRASAGTQGGATGAAGSRALASGGSAGASGGAAGTNASIAQGGGERGSHPTVAAGGSGGHAVESAGAGEPGSAGEPSVGEAGRGGEAGAEPAPCQKNEDCPNPDPDCRAECRSTALGNTCVILAADHDGDQHGSAACEAAPGDDCDDTHATVYPNAPELCDARDNDCDGKRDFDDGLGLRGSAHVVTQAPTYDVDIAWSPSQLTWGAFWSEASTNMFQPMDRSGTARVAPLPVTDAPEPLAAPAARAVGRRPKLLAATSEPAKAALPNYPVTHSLAISWGEDALGNGAFALAFPGRGPDTVLKLVAVDGTTLVPAVPLTDTPDGWGSDGPDLQWLGSQNVWAAAWTDLRDNTFEPLVRTVSLVGSFGPEAYPGFGSAPTLAVAGGQLAELWSGFDATRGVLLSAQLDVTEIDLASELELRSPFFAGRSDRFGVVFSAPPDKFAYAEIAPDGTLICGPVLREANGFIQSDIVPVAEGFLILAAQPTVQALEVLPGCHFGSTIELDATPASFVRGGNGDDGVFIAWGGPEQELEARIIGPHICD